MGPVVPELESVGQNKKKLDSHFYFSIGGIFIASVDPPSRESTDHGLTSISKLPSWHGPECPPVVVIVGDCSPVLGCCFCLLGFRLPGRAVILVDQSGSLCPVCWPCYKFLAINSNSSCQLERFTSFVQCNVLLIRYGMFGYNL